MKRFFRPLLYLTLLGAAASSDAALYSATGAGSSTIGGVSPDYPFLFDAVAAINLAGTRDATTWTFYIQASTTEASNIYLACNMAAGGKIIFKPSPSTTPTITFTAAPGIIAGTLGTNFGIGAPSDAFPAASTGTNGIEIDGSNTVAGTTRDLTFTHSTPITTNGHALIAIVGDTDNTVIKNCIINQTSTSANTATTPLSVRPALVGGSSLTPDFWTVENCALTSTASTGSVGINLTASGSLAAGSAAHDFTIRNCDINARIRGIFINPGYGFTLDGNRIQVGTSGTVAGTDTWGVFVNSANTPGANTTTVSNNRLLVRNGSTTTDTQGPTGLGLSSMGSGLTTRFINVYNNEVTIVNTGARNGGISANTRGIWFGTSAVTCRAYNNTIYMPDNLGTANALANPDLNAFGIGGHSITAYNDTYRGNIVVVGEANVPAIAETAEPAGGGSGFASDYNTIYVSGGAVTARRLVAAVQTNYNTLLDYQTAFPAHEPNSDQFDPTPSFVSTSITTPDLTLNAATRTIEDWGVTPDAFNTATVTTDYSGQARNATHPYRGFDELAALLSPASVGDWMMLQDQ